MYYVAGSIDSHIGEERIEMEPNKKLPLFIVSGASGVGKTTMCEILFRRETKYIVMESDILWKEEFNTP